MGKDVDLDHLKWLLDRISNYVRDVDAKNGVILAAMAVMAAILFSNTWFCSMLQEGVQGESWLKRGLIGLIVILFVLVLVFLFLSLVPRLDSGEKSKSLIFFKDVSSFDSAEKLMEAFRNPDYSLTKDLLSQIRVNSEIAAKKMKWHSRAIKAFAMFALVVLAFCLVAILLP